VMGLGQNFLTQVGSATSGFGKFPLKIPNFKFFLFGPKKSYWVGSKNTWVKDRLVPYLLWVKSMLGLGSVLARL